MNKKDKEKVIELLADYAHNSWSGWMDYMFSKCSENKDGTITIPSTSVERWQRQMKTTYDDLSEEEKWSDRDQAEKILKVLSKYLGE
jgi:hypothetical protein